MKLPNPERAVADIAKLRDYCLNPRHPRGRHKARTFQAALGITRENAELLQAALLRAAATVEAIEGERDDYGLRYVIDFEMKGPAGQKLVRSCWIVRTGEAFPRLTSCYLL